MAAAHAAFKPVKKPATDVPRASTVPRVRELVSIRIDADVLGHFQEGGPGWQDRINEALRIAAGKAQSADEGKRPDQLNATNDD